jgi:hypothetical protein
MSDQDIANQWNCGSSSAVSGNQALYTWSGILNGAFGMIYPNAFGWMLDDDKKQLKTLQQDLDDTQNVWKTKLANAQGKDKDAQAEFYQDQIDFIQTTQDFNKQILEEEIGTDTLLIQIIMGILIIIIIYLIFL